MPFKSEAQKRKFFVLYKKGKISKKVLDEFLQSTGKKKLPKRVTKKKSKGRKR